MGWFQTAEGGLWVYFNQQLDYSSGANILIKHRLWDASPRRKFGTLQRTATNHKIAFSLQLKTENRQTNDQILLITIILIINEQMCICVCKLCLWCMHLCVCGGGGDANLYVCTGTYVHVYTHPYVHANPPSRTCENPFPSTSNMCKVSFDL